MFHLVFLLTSAFALEIPRGVPFSRSALYSPGKSFSFLDGSGVIPWFKVNNDYCDSPDGSDEPGTAACPNGVFFCRDVQYKSVSVPSAYVNDGVCDCCDGSDEYDGNTMCESTCGTLAAAVKQARLIARVEIEEGHKLFLDYVEKLEVRMEEERKAEEQAARERELLEAEQARIAAEQPPSDEGTTVPEEAQPDAGDTAQVAPAEDEIGKVRPDADDVASEEQSSDPTTEEDGTEEHEEQEGEDHYRPSGGPVSHVSSPPPPPPLPPVPIDHGPRHGFRMLTESDSCLEFSDRQYIYSLCAFKGVHQRNLGQTGLGTSLGRWNDWAYAEHDVDKVNKYGVMLYSNGESCWGGPQRSTKVYVHCGGKNELLTVAEPSRCEYEMHLRTPAACFEHPDVIFNRLHPEE